ncbi:MAG TPA: ATP-binding protein [Thermomicrobiales bacterium]|nr:ATP-binding protein [Thermomicrobiales bacterium]
MKDRSTGQYSINRRLMAGLVAIVLLVLLLVIALLFALRYDNSREAAIRDEYYPRLLLAEQARSAIIDQQSAVRGFIITNDEGFLTPFDSAREAYVAARDQLLAFDTINPEVDALRDRQFDIAETWYESVALPEIEARRAGTRTEDQESAMLETGSLQLNDFRAENATYQAALREEIDTAVDDAANVQSLLFGGAVVGSIAILALITGVVTRLLGALRQPLAAVSTVTAAVNVGETDRRIAKLPAREFDAVGQGINQMLDSLAATVADANLQRQRTAAIVDSASEGIVVVDSAGNVTNINPSAARMFETTIEAARDQPAAHLGYFTGEEIGDTIERAQGGAVQPVVRRRGNRVLSAAVSTLQGDDSETSSGLVWVLRDVTALAQIDEMKSEFISIVSHELRTPLTAIKGFTDLILEGEVGEISNQQREFLEIVQSNSDRLVALINDMLDISRIESGRISLNPEEVHIPAAVDHAVTALRPLIDEKGLQIQTELVEEPAAVVADRARLQQILINLISNACKYTLAGGWITVRSEALEGQIAISVSDTGIGIPPEALPHIFSKFYRVDQPQTRDVGGTGLGLAITKSLVEMHGGKIAIASRAGVGTTVRFTLPTLGPSDNGTHDPSMVGINGTGLVLIVSGEAADREAWDAAIRAVPADVVIARGTSAAAAAGEAELHRPSVIVVRCKPGHELSNLDELIEEMQASAELRMTPVVAVVPDIAGSTKPDDGMLLGSAATPEEVAAAVSSLLPEATGARPRRGRVLVAEDDVDMANWLRRVLVRNGFEVVLVRDGLAAIVRAVEILPDAVILDVNMPKMGASEVLPQLLSNPGTREIPIIVVSGTVPDSGPYFLEAGASEFFSKPFNGDLLVRRLIQLSRKRQDG